MSVPAAGSTKLSNVQGLRALAAALVVASHVGDPRGGFEKMFLSPSNVYLLPLQHIGHYGVDLFFVISGFIMIVTGWNEFGRPARSFEFICRRMVRIYPPYWVILLAILVVYVADPRLLNPSSPIRPDIWASFLLLPQAGESLLLVSWTLVFEMAFYYVFAIALCFKRRGLPVVLLLWAIAIVLSGFVFSSSSNVYLRFLGNPQVPSAALWSRVVLAGAGFSALLYGLVLLELSGRFRGGKFCDIFGDASYAVYLWHLPVLTALGLLILRIPPSMRSLHKIWVVVGFAAVFATSLLVFHLIERPLTRNLNRYLKHHLPSAP